MNTGQMLSRLAHSSLKVHCSYRLKFFVAKNHLRSSSLSNCSLLGSRFARSYSTRPSQRSKYTEGVALCMRICIAVQRLSRKCVQKKIRPKRRVWPTVHISQHPLQLGWVISSCAPQSLHCFSDNCSLSSVSKTLFGHVTIIAMKAIIAHPSLGGCWNKSYRGS